MATRIRSLGLALLAVLLASGPSFALDDDPLGLAAGARAVEGAVRKGRQGMLTAHNGWLNMSVLQFGGHSLTPDLLTLSGRYQALEHLWMSARLSQPALRAPNASLGLSLALGPVTWSLSAATSRPNSNGFAPGADLSGTWRF